MDFLLRQLETFIYALAIHGHIVFLGTLAIGIFGLGPIGRAVAARIKGGTPSDDALTDLRNGMSELQERLDFSERVLGEVRQRLIGGESPAAPKSSLKATTPV